MKKSNNKIIHKLPLSGRIMSIFSAIMLTALPIVMLILGFEPKINAVIILFAMLLYCFLTFLNVFKRYICLDIDNQKIIIREGTKKEELSMINLTELQVVDDQKYNLFSLNIIFGGYIKKDFSWSTGPDSGVLFGTLRGQRKRLEKFCEECNQYLKNK